MLGNTSRSQSVAVCFTDWRHPMPRIMHEPEIDLSRADESVPLNRAARFLPGGIRPSHSTWWRWWRRGVRGVRLRTWLVGGQRHTSAEAIAEWIEEVTAAGAGFPITSPVAPCAPRRSVDSAVVAQMEADGI